MATIGAFEAKTHFSELLDRAKNGERITITKRGVPAAMLVPIGQEERPSARDVVAELKRVRKGLSIGKGLTIRDLIDDGRKR